MTEAGKRLLYERWGLGGGVTTGERQRLIDAIAAIEAEAVAAERARIVAEVRAEAGPLCVCPDEEMPVCETHSELCFDGHCEDFPTWLAAVLRIIEGGSE